MDGRWDGDSGHDASVCETRELTIFDSSSASRDDSGYNDTATGALVRLLIRSTSVVEAVKEGK